MKLRDYQEKLHDEVYAAWDAGHQNVLLRSGTGTGKTVTFAHVIAEQAGAVIALAHTKNIIAQISLALAREGVRHRIIGPTTLIKLCVARHMRELKRSFYDATARVGVGSVQTVVKYKDDAGWFNQVQLWVQDEAHHVLRDNQFGKALARFPNARGLGVTACTKRADGKGLGRKSHGVFDALVLGPPESEMVARGYLCKYRIFAPPNDFHRETIKITASGELSAAEVKAATKRSTILGDIVEHYVTKAMGKRGLTFSDCIENATDIARRFRAAGVPAEVLTGDTDPYVQEQVLLRFEQGEVKQIVSVQLIDEGFDCPTVEVVSDGAATESLNRYRQRFGRGWRPSAGKDYMMYFDHVGNVARHGLPDKPIKWDLDPIESRGARSKINDTIPLRTCTECAGVYERIYTTCPYCGHAHEPAGRSSPEQVDGDLIEMDPFVSASMWKEVARIDGPCYPPQHLDAMARRGVQNAHHERQQAQAALRETMNLWAGWKNKLGHDMSQAYRLFYFRYGMTVPEAMVLGAREAGEMQARVQEELNVNGVVRE